ncbi:MAG TPA: radical SAM protein [Terriglobales bacterium]|nr:radical SAM protein [Terriglobales bacterium]
MLPDLKLYPEADPQKLVGIAKLAAQGEHLRDGHQVEYLTLPARSLLNRCSAKHMPFQWTINPYRGCEFACKYCYARFTHEFMELRDGLDFERKIYVKQQTAWLLRRDLRRVKKGHSIAIGTATDPYQPAEKRFEVTRGILEELALHSGLSIGMVTKSQMVTRDIGLMQRIAASNDLSINVTITTMDADLARILEPRAPRPDLRMAAVKALVRGGIHAGVICAPVLPAITDTPRNLDGLVKAAAAAGAKFIYTNPLFLKPCSEKILLPFLHEHFPHLEADYRSRFKENGYVSAAYRQRLGKLMDALCHKHCMPDQEERRENRLENAVTAEHHKAEQLALF